MERSWRVRLAVPVSGVLIALAVAGCAGRAAAPGSAGAGSAAPSSTASPVPGTTPSTDPSAGCASVGVAVQPVTLTEADNGKAVCVATGATVEVYLHAGSGPAWTRPQSDGAALAPTASGKGALQVGVSAGFFRAAQPGPARITAQRAVCGTGPKPGVMCEAMQLFTVSVTVR